jgi:hypothetical protein
MAHHLETNGSRHALRAAVRNRYFYGKLLDVPHLELEQRYFIGRRRMLNRLALGFGVLCGLDVRAVGTGVIVEPGVAIDGLGREIVVDAPVRVPEPLALPADPCDREGNGEPREEAVLCLAFHECAADPTPVLVADCEIREECEPGSVRERFKLLALDPGETHRPPTLDAEQCRAIFGRQPSDAAPLRERVCEVLSGPCADPCDCCVPLALIRQEGDGLTVRSCPVRISVYSNAELFELILCLAARVEECCRPTRSLPVVVGLFPKPRSTVTPVEIREALEDGVLAVTFDRAMDETRLQQPDPWLRAWILRPPNDDGDVAINRIPLELARTTDQPFLGLSGFTAVFRIPGGSGGPVTHLPSHLPPGDDAGLRVLVQIRADDATTGPVDRSTPTGQLLDAEFAGSGLTGPTLDKIWPATTTTVRDIWNSIPGGTGQLPSGDGAEGGRLHSFFEVTS